mmetsp:Transcript_64771/g.181076  ORF Transcript_64771/g.181076 Transcript_64771/m.181076 type:complete len:353 (-) Transcript_64771:33-1091(-)
MPVKASAALTGEPRLASKSLMSSLTIFSSFSGSRKSSRMKRSACTEWTHLTKRGRVSTIFIMSAENMPKASCLERAARPNNFSNRRNISVIFRCRSSSGRSSVAAVESTEFRLVLFFWSSRFAFLRCLILRRLFSLLVADVASSLSASFENASCANQPCKRSTPPATSTNLWASSGDTAKAPRGGASISMPLRSERPPASAALSADAEDVEEAPQEDEEIESFRLWGATAEGGPGSPWPLAAPPGPCASAITAVARDTALAPRANSASTSAFISSSTASNNSFSVKSSAMARVPASLQGRCHAGLPAASPEAACATPAPSWGWPEAEPREAGPRGQSPPRCCHRPSSDKTCI